MTRKITTTGIARVIARGLVAQFGENDKGLSTAMDEAEKLQELLYDLGVAREDDALESHFTDTIERAEEDAEILDDLGTKILEEMEKLNTQKRENV